MNQMEELVRKINKLNEELQLDLFVCCGCNKLQIGEGNYLPIDEGHEERIFCENCTFECSCGSLYCEIMGYQHEDCN